MCADDGMYLPDYSFAVIDAYPEPPLSPKYEATIFSSLPIYGRDLQT
jgi:hypothetical protein